MKNPLDYIFAFLVLSIVLFSCGSKKDLNTTKENQKVTVDEKVNSITPLTSLPKYVILGEGGGITGEYEEYKLMADGRVLKKDFKKDKFVDHKKLSPEDTRAILEQLENISMVSGEPGNMNSYMEVLRGDEKTRVEWSDMSPAEPTLVEFKNSVMEKLR